MIPQGYPLWFATVTDGTVKAGRVVAWRPDGLAWFPVVASPDAAGMVRCAVAVMEPGWLADTHEGAARQAKASLPPEPTQQAAEDAGGEAEAGDPKPHILSDVLARPRSAPPGNRQSGRKRSPDDPSDPYGRKRRSNG